MGGDVQAAVRKEQGLQISEHRQRAGEKQSGVSSVPSTKSHLLPTPSLLCIRE